MGYNQENKNRSKTLLEHLNLEYKICLKNFELKKLFFKMGIILEKTVYILFPKQKLLKKFFIMLISRISKQKKLIKFEANTHAFIQNYKI